MSKYNKEFYARRHRNTYTSASEILHFVHDIIDFKSAVDVGCGVGTWLCASKELGADTVRGFEGDWLDENNAVIDATNIYKQDLEQRVTSEQRFDLAITLEVAEHLTSARAETFVGDLCALSDCVLFGAAIPGQGGTHHINEQWQSYWAQMFAAQGYAAYDIVRWKFWSRQDIAVWYRQNTVIYARSGSDADTALQRVAPAVTDLQTLDIVHPAMFAYRVRPDLKGALRYLARSALSKLQGSRAGDVGSPLIPSPSYQFEYQARPGNEAS